MDAKLRELERLTRQGDPAAIQQFWTRLKALYEPAALDGDIDALPGPLVEDGNHRLVAAKYLGLKSLPVK
jgi:hypothetical protein